MIGINSAPYNDLDISLYGGQTRLARHRAGMRDAGRKIARGLYKAWTYTPLGTAYRHLTNRRGITRGTGRIRGKGVNCDSEGLYGGGWGDYSSELFGGRARRRKRPTKKQLRALAKGRAKLRALRRLKGGAAKRRFKSSMGGDSIYGPVASNYSRPRYSQEGVDDAALQLMKIHNRMVDDYGLGSPDFTVTPAIYPLAQKVNNLVNYIHRGERLGYEPSYPIPKKMTDDFQVLADAQKANNVSRAMRTDGPHPIKSIVRKILQDNGLPHSPAAVNNAIRKGRINIYDDYTSLPVYDRNVFDDNNRAPGGVELIDLPGVDN